MLRFGPSGNGDVFYDQGFKSSLDAPKWLKNRGLTSYEYSFSRGFNISDFVAKTLGEKCKENNIEISVHAPYYINLANPDKTMVEKSFNYILTSLKYLKLMGGKRCVFHPGTCGKLQREEAFKLIKENMALLAKRIEQEGFSDMLVCPETMGKSMQIGTYQEIAELCKIAPFFVPCMDFGHINCVLQGKLKEEKDFEQVLTFMLNNLGYKKMKNFHIHFSKIEYGPKGEIKHLTFEDEQYGPEFEPLAKVLKKLNLEPDVICESKGTQPEDAQTMKEIFEKLQ